MFLTCLLYALLQGTQIKRNWHPPQHPGLVLELRREDKLLLGMMRRFSHTQLPLAGMKLQIMFHVGKHLHWSTGAQW
jgi:hypothetical protein